MDDRMRVIDALRNSKLFAEYACAFREITGIRLFLDAARSPDKPQVLRVSPVAYSALIPIKDAARIVAMIRTGPIWEGDGTAIPVTRLKQGPIPTIPRSEFGPFLKILSAFADHLGTVTNQIVLFQANCEPAIVRSAKHYIHSYYRDPLRLEEVANHANVSRFYLCKIFKRCTGLNFSNYICRIRIDAAKQLLDRRQMRINEVALEVGFQSLTHFNRVFKRFVGESPRAYRRRTSQCKSVIVLSRIDGSLQANNRQLMGNFREERPIL